ncbi:hypothetical protein Fcan01_17911 [Folsomia candida]|uniref:Uncharacterized protein n=1 Tax=Folsomia candida TaxID=158441 RepID=A0A226DPS8_FOLCA|nr:hypothetical protein Fcan01_17911 [Folsomia candida]
MVKESVKLLQDPTTTPATTAPTTTPLSTTTEHWPEPGMIFQLISYISARAMEVYQSDLNNYNKIHAHLDLHDCMYPAQVWKLELNGSDYIFQSALGGSNQWNHIMNRCRPSPTYPCIVVSLRFINITRIRKN